MPYLPKNIYVSLFRENNIIYFFFLLILLMLLPPETDNKNRHWRRTKSAKKWRKISLNAIKENMRECCGDEFLFVRMPVVEIYNRDCDCPKCFGRAHSLSIFFYMYKFKTIFFPLILVFSVTKRRFHLNVLLFCKYKLWPLKHVLHRR